jgi:hypothetical protein
VNKTVDKYEQPYKSAALYTITAHLPYNMPILVIIPVGKQKIYEIYHKKYFIKLLRFTMNSNETLAAIAANKKICHAPFLRTKKASGKFPRLRVQYLLK